MTKSRRRRRHAEAEALAPDIAEEPSEDIAEAESDDAEPDEPETEDAEAAVEAAEAEPSEEEAAEEEEAVVEEADSAAEDEPTTGVLEARPNPRNRPMTRPGGGVRRTAKPLVAPQPLTAVIHSSKFIHRLVPVRRCVAG